MKMTIFASLILATLAFAGCQSAATRQETKTETKMETKMKTTQTQKEIAQVSVTDVKQAIEDKKDAQFIDVRARPFRLIFGGLGRALMTEKEHFKQKLRK